MSSSPAVPEPRNLRASDADRERVANVLREAAGDGRLTMDELDERLDAVYAAKTYAELEPITHDLPDAGAAHAPAPSSAAPRDPARFGGVPTSSGAVAILGGFSRKGDWVVPKEFTAFMFMGGGEIDMRDARFSEREVTIHIVAIMGGCEVIVPEDATVYVTGIGILGAFEHTRKRRRKPRRPGDQRSTAWPSWAASTSSASRPWRPAARRGSSGSRPGASGLRPGSSTTRTGTSTTTTGTTAAGPASWTSAGRDGLGDGTGSLAAAQGHGAPPQSAALVRDDRS